jgi:hypothetical protein
MLTGKRLGRILARASETQCRNIAQHLNRHIHRDPANSSGTSTARPVATYAGDGDLGPFRSNLA